MSAMLLPTLQLLASLAGFPGGEGAVYSGRASTLDVQLPRVAAEATIDGNLDEAAWAKAAVLTGFSRYAPDDGAPAADSTEVLVWYSATAIHFGIRAFAAPGTVRATLAERDKIYSDDYVVMFLGTFNDGRQATAFAVNPFGVQGDGTVLEGSRGAQGIGRESADISPNFVFESKGHLTEWGYQVEVRIPFKTLRYPSADPQTWGLSIIRRKQALNHEDSWAPARRAAASFLGQGGRLVGLTGMQRGLVLDVTPEVTGRQLGAPDAAGRWNGDRPRGALGGNVRWGLGSAFTLSGTVNPDFSQVEADAGQVVFDPRDALFFPEARPFFLEGIEQFQTPIPLVYTRRVVQPNAAAKVTGAVAGANVALLSAMDDRLASADSQHVPVVNVLRAQRKFGSGGRAGMLVTDRRDGDRANTVFALDGRHVVRKVYALQAQVGGSRTVGADGTVRTAPVWRGEFNRSGRTFGMRVVGQGIDPDFRAATGFVRRTDYAEIMTIPRLTHYGAAGSLVETLSGEVMAHGVWAYDTLMAGQRARDERLHFTARSQLRGGWQLAATYMIESWGYDANLFDGVQVEGPGGATPFTGGGRLPARDVQLNVGTPRFSTFQLWQMVLWGRDVDFYQWAPADIVFAETELQWRPTERARIDATHVLQRIVNPAGPTVVRQQIPRVRLEYQVARPLLVRAVGEYNAQMRAALRDAGRTGGRLLADAGDGTLAPIAKSARNRVRADWLVQYMPRPGTIVYAGYSGTLADARAYRFREVERVREMFFVKASWLYRF